MSRARKASPAGRPALSWLAQFVLPLLAALALIAGVVWLGRLARDDMRRGEEGSFADLDCAAPPGMTRREFLAEAAASPEGDERTAAGVRRRLEAHPWVQRVERVRVPPGGPMRAEVVFRVAVLWVESADQAVDRDAVLLPASARRDGLLGFTGPVSPPPKRAGQKWDDAAVRSAARLAAHLAGRIDSGRLTCEAEGDELVLWAGARRILWGRPPGHEKRGEPDAAAKTVRLSRVLRAGEDADLRR